MGSTEKLKERDKYNNKMYVQAQVKFKERERRREKRRQ